MRHRVQIAVIFIAWFFATGSQWDLAQIVAWGSMFTRYSQEMSVVDAARKTFSGEKCRLCKIAQNGKQQHEANGETAPGGKASGQWIDLFAVNAVTGVISPVRQTEGKLASIEMGSGRGRSSPPSPPPRA